MAPSSSSSSSSSNPQQPSHFTPIQECDREENAATPPPHHNPTPLHKNGAKKTAQRAQNDDPSVSCNKCRPSAREKISIVPLDHSNNNGVSSSHGKVSSPNAAAAAFRSLISSLTRRSPAVATREEQWKIAVAELTHKLVQATRRRDEALLESSRLKNSMAELEKKLNKLEHYCLSLKSGLDECASLGAVVNSRRGKDYPTLPASAVDDFLAAVAEARGSVRALARSLASQLRHVGAKVHDRISAVALQPSSAGARSPRVVLLHLEALLNRSFFEDFETVAFLRNATAGRGMARLDPAESREARRRAFLALRGLTWEEVLSRGTKHFCEEFSGFCDRKMSEIVTILGWNRAWPEPLLQAFFVAAKGVWLVHLLANSVQPAFEVFRVDKDVVFDAAYMDDMGGSGPEKWRNAAVRIMVAPGFYVGGNVVKCKVVCKNNNGDNNANNVGINGDEMRISVTNTSNNAISSSR